MLHIHFSLIGRWVFLGFFSFLFATPPIQAQTIAISRTSKLTRPSVVSRKNSLARLAELEMRSLLFPSFLEEYYGIQRQDSNAVISGIISFRTAPNETLHQEYALTKVHGSELHTFSSALQNLPRLANHPSVEYISLARKAVPLMDNALKDAAIDPVQRGDQLPVPLTGKGVLAGLVDVGIEYTHPTFRNAAGDTNRIIKAWAQNRKSGRKPQGFRYGVEFVGSHELAEAQFDSSTESHGTFVLGCLSASTYGSNGRMRGVAPGSDIIAVSSGYFDNSILDGASYFFQEAKRMDKKGVFNMSWGSNWGPHDGTSLFDQAIDSMIGNGAVVIGAVGNAGTAVIHLRHPSSSVATTTSSLVERASNEFSVVDLWGQENSSFEVSLRFYDIRTGQPTYSSKKFSTRLQVDSAFYVVDGLDTATVYVITSTKDVYNGRPEALVAVQFEPSDSVHQLAISISSQNNEVHAWGAQNATFTHTLKGKKEALPDFVKGDSEYTVSEIGGTSKQIISVGWHLTRRSYSNYKGEIKHFSVDSGFVANFSSQGPTLDGRTKPDLTAPSGVIVPLSRFAPRYRPGGVEDYLLSNEPPLVREDTTWYWIALEASSFSAPIVAGAAALLLEATPSLDQAQIKELLLKNTTVDQYTGIIPPNGSNKWGFGKLNLYKAVSELYSPTAIGDLASYTLWNSNPVQSKMVVHIPSSQQATELHIHNVLGQGIIYIKKPIRQEGDFVFYDLTDLAPGQYVGRFDAENKKGLIVKITKIE